MDFTLFTYRQLLKALEVQGFFFQTFKSFVGYSAEETVVLRHDVDRLPGNALKMARLEHELGIVATYYFRTMPASWNEDIICKIAFLGHEIGYHYENLSLCKGNFELALADFKSNLVKLSALVPVTTICMHGSPLSKWDNRDLWKKYDYRELGIIAEPYFDVDFDEVLYLTDTGRRWDGNKVSVRDKVSSNHKNQNFKFRSTMDIIRAIESGLLPDKIMITTHPQRWNNRFVPWAKELIWQNMKNVVKKALYVGNRG